MIYTDWKAEKDQESGKLVSSKPQYAISTHAGPVHCLHRSPFYNHIIMSVGGYVNAVFSCFVLDFRDFVHTKTVSTIDNSFLLNAIRIIFQ